MMKKIHTHLTPTLKRTYYVCEERMKPCRQLTAHLPWWNNSTVCKKREPWSAQSSRGPWTTENCFAGNQRHICRRRHHTAICVCSRRNIIIIAVVKSSQTLPVFLKDPKTFWRWFPVELCRFFLQPHKKVLRYHESATLSAIGFPMHLGDLFGVSSKVLRGWACRLFSHFNLRNNIQLGIRGSRPQTAAMLGKTVWI